MTPGRFFSRIVDKVKRQSLTLSTIWTPAAIIDTIDLAVEPISLALMATAAGQVVDSLLGEHANKVVAAVVGGFIGNRADAAVCGAVSNSWNYFRNLRTTDPILNHDLERATREAYLIATRELVRQAELRAQVGGTASTFLHPGEQEALARIAAGVKADLGNVADTLPERVPDAQLFLLDPETAPAERVRRLRETLRRNLDLDLARWIPGVAPPRQLADLLKTGWTIDTKHLQNVPRDWYSLIAIAFVEKLKTDERLNRVFEAKLLAEVATREPRAAAVATFTGFAAGWETVVAPLQRIEDSLGVLSRDVAEIKSGVQEIKETLAPIARIPRWVWLSLGVLAIAGTLGLATGAGVQAACAVPGVRAVCGGLGWGGVPSAAEEALWAARKPGDCDGLRGYLARYPAGAFAARANSLLEARRTRETETWTPREKILPLAVRAGLDGLPSEAAARQDALARGAREAELACAPYGSGEFRLRSAEARAREWRCAPRGAGIGCGFDGEAVCRVEARRRDLAEVCANPLE